MSARTRTGRAVILLGAAAAAVFIGSAAAAASTVPLHDAHRNTTAAAFADHSCQQIPGGAPVAGRDGFVFVLPKNDADFVTLTLTFRTTGGSVVNVTIPDVGDSHPDGITTNGTSKAFVLVPKGWILLDGTATVSGATKAKFFNLTHTCVGTSKTAPPTTAPSGSPSGSSSGEGTPTESSPGTAPPGGTGGGAGGAGLPVTGMAVGAVALTGLALIAAGAALLLWPRARATA